MSTDWEFSKTTGKCAVTGRLLTEGESYYAVLFDRPDGLERLDYGDDGWTGPPEGNFCFWRARVPVREKKPSLIAVDHELLIQLFLRLEDEDSEMKQQFRFVLALLLMRKRLLKHEQTVRDGDQEYWQLRLVREQSTHQVLNPHLTDEEVERLSEQLTAILSGDVATLRSMEEPDLDEETSVIGESAECESAECESVAGEAGEVPRGGNNQETIPEPTGDDTDGEGPARWASAVSPSEDDIADS